MHETSALWPWPTGSYKKEGHSLDFSPGFPMQIWTMAHNQTDTWHHRGSGHGQIPRSFPSFYNDQTSDLQQPEMPVLLLEDCSRSDKKSIHHEVLHLPRNIPGRNGQWNPHLLPPDFRIHSIFLPIDCHKKILSVIQDRAGTGKKAIGPGFSFSSSAKSLLYPFPVTVPYFHNHLFLILPQDFLQYYLSFPNNSEDNSRSSLLVLFFYVITSTLLPISSLFRSLVTTIFFSIRSFSSETWEMIPTRRLPSVSPCNALTA